MARRGRRRTSGSAGPPRRSGGGPTASSRESRKPGKWVGGIITAVVTAVLIAGATAGATSAWHFIFSKHSSVPKGPPIRVASINLGQCVHPCAEAGDFVFPKKIIFSTADVKHIAQLLSSISGMNSYGEWMRNHGGVDVGNVDIQLALVGNWPQGARIMNMEPVGSCTKPLTGTYSMFIGAGSEPTIPLGFNLDKPGGEAQVIKNYNGGSNVRLGEDYFLHNTVSLKYKEQQVFQIAAFTKNQYCQFRIKMKVLLGGQREVNEIVGNGKNPFKVTGGLWPPPDHYPVVYGGSIGASPCLAKGEVGNQFGMIKPYLFCVAR